MLLVAICGVSVLLSSAWVAPFQSTPVPMKVKSLRRHVALNAQGGLFGNLFSPRFGKSLTRDFPKNAEMIGTLKVLFDVTLSKPLGIRLSNGPDGPGKGCGVAEVADRGSVPELLADVLKGKDSMWVQEGDALEAVNDQPVASEDEATELIAGAGKEVKLTFSRPRTGYIKVVFPGGLQVTSPRAAILARLADKVGYDCGCRCRDGRCGKCWHKDEATGEIYVLPLNAPGVVPSVWRTSGEDQSAPGMDYECWIPLVLQPAPEAYAEALQAEAAENE